MAARPLGRGALRVAAWFLAAHSVVWLRQANHAHTASPASGTSSSGTSAATFFYAMLLWVGYVAVEPYMRRQWPETLISWTRLLAGRFADPRVGRDVLIGAAMGGAVALLEWLIYALPAWRAGEPLPSCSCCGSERWPWEPSSSSSRR